MLLGMRPSDFTQHHGPVTSAPAQFSAASTQVDAESQRKPMSFDEKSVEPFPDFDQNFHLDQPPKTLSHQRSDSTLTADGAHPGKLAYPAPSHLKPHAFDGMDAPSALSPTGADYVYASMMKTPTFSPAPQQK